MRYASTFRGRAMALVLVGLAVVTAACDATQASVGSRGEPGNGDSTTSGGLRALSADGRWVLFTSSATAFAGNDTNGYRDVFLRDQVAKRTIRVSDGTDGSAAAGDSVAGTITANGRIATFASTAGNVVRAGTPADGNWYGYLWDNGRAELVSRGPDGTPLPNAFGFVPVVSANGRWVAFAGAPNSELSPSMFVLDRWSRTVKPVGFSAWFSPVAISDDGHTLAATYFCSTGCRAQGNALFDPIADTLVWSPPISAPEYTYTYAESSGLAISDDGRHVAYSLSPVCFAVIDYDACYAQPNQVRIEDRVTHRTTIVTSSSGMLSQFDLSIANDGRTLVYRTGTDTFVRTQDRGVVATSSAGAGTDVWYPSLSGDGRTLAFTSRDSSAFPDDTNGQLDVFTAGIGRVQRRN